jgi:DUF971 family protein
MIPKSIKQTTPTELVIEWDDGHKGRYTLQSLRLYCPCAACKSEAERRETSDLLPILTAGKNELRSVQPIGSYAVQLRWADGHSTGIYTYDYLRQLCECDGCRAMSGE